MISVVICGRSHEVSPELKENIDSTIGCKYELIYIDNSNGQYNIFSAYNKGVELSKGAIVCFVHDDVLFRSDSWGICLEKHFENSELGMLGVGGPTYLSSMPTIWWANRMSEHEEICVNSIDTDRYNHANTRRVKCPAVPDADHLEVVALDGVFFAIRREIFEKVSFDEHTYNGGYHFYDLDISFQIRKLGWKIACIYDVLIEHFSTSDNLTKTWVDACRIFYDKWNKYLPAICRAYTSSQCLEMKINAGKLMNRILVLHSLSLVRFYNLKELLLSAYYFALRKFKIY